VALLGGVETGGTRCACIIAGDPDRIVAEASFPTTTPAETINRIVSFFRGHFREYPIRAVGIGSFGPLDLDPLSPTWGHITTTPKPGWTDVDVCGPIGDALLVPVALDTDVNAAALGEYYCAAEGRVVDPLLYLTVGTGIGLGAVVQGQPLHGLVHPEAGHMLVPHDWARDPFAGTCPFHGDCWEGLASGHALEQRWGQPGENLPPDHHAWALEARYLGIGVADLIYCLSPRRVIMGGGVMRQPGLMERVREEVRETIRGYLRPGALAEGLERLILPPSLDGRSGVLGALLLAKQAAAS
jgi:fructokinase